MATTGCSVGHTCERDASSDYSSYFLFDLESIIHAKEFHRKDKHRRSEKDDEYPHQSDVIEKEAVA